MKQNRAQRRKEAADKRGLAPGHIITRDGYSTFFEEQAYKLCLIGLDLGELADFFGVSEDRVKEWEDAYPDFAAALHRGRTMADAKVAESLYKRATGYEHERIRIIEKDGSAIKETTTEHRPPDVKAALEWLKLRQKNKWDSKAASKHGSTAKLPPPIIQIYQCGPPPASSEAEVYEREQIGNHHV